MAEKEFIRSRKVLAFSCDESHETNQLKTSPFERGDLN